MAAHHRKSLTHAYLAGGRKDLATIFPKKSVSQINYELAFIEKKKLASYFLTGIRIYAEKPKNWDICTRAVVRQQFTVCYCLGITAVNPTKSRLLFSRFMSDARDEWPDMDVDFEHERREEDHPVYI